LPDNDRNSDIGNAAACGDFVDANAVKVGEILVLGKPGQFDSGEMRNELNGRIRMILFSRRQLDDALLRGGEIAHPHQQPRTKAFDPPFDIEAEQGVMGLLDVSDVRQRRIAGLKRFPQPSGIAAGLAQEDMQHGPDAGIGNV
jgi:hypothetical protein